MHRSKTLRRRASGIGITLALGATIVGSGVVSSSAAMAAANAKASTARVSAPQTVISGLNSPRHLTVGPDGALYVVEAGTGGPGPTGPNCVATTNEGGDATTDCLGTTGLVARVTTGGALTSVLSGLPSIVTEPAGGLPAEYVGPAATAYVNGKFEVVTEVQDLNSDGTNQFGAAGSNLGNLITASPVRRQAPGR
jgi:hypothetical protein